MSISRSLQTISALIVLFVLARFLLTPEELSHYRKLWPFYSLFGPVVISAVVNAAYFHGSDHSDTRSSLQQATRLLILGGLLVGVSAYLAADFLAAYFNIPDKSDAFVLFSIYATVAIWGSLAEPLFVLTQHKRKLPIYTFCFTLVDIASILIPFGLGLQVIEVLQWMILAQISRQLVLIPLYIKWLRPLPKPKQRILFVENRVLMYALGMGMLALAGVGTVEIDRFIVGRLLDDTSFILYDIGARKLPFISIITASVTSAIVAGYAAQVVKGIYTDALAKIQRTTNMLSEALLPMLVVLACGAPSLVALIFGEEYRGAGPVFAWFIVALMSNILFPHALVLASGRSMINVLGSVAELFINVALSLWLINYWGIVGVAIASAIAHWVYTLSMMVYCRSQFSIPMRDFLPKAPKVVRIVVIAFAGLAAWYLNDEQSWLIILVIIPVGIYSLYRLVPVKKV